MHHIGIFSCHLAEFLIAKVSANLGCGAKLLQNRPVQR
jgi:hypothetical protein